MPRKKTQQRAPMRWESITLPAHQSQGTKVRIPLHERTGFHVTSRRDPQTRIEWWFAVDTHRWDNPDPTPEIGETLTELSHTVWMHEGSPPTPVTRETVERQHGWFHPTAEALARRRQVMRETRREEFKQLNLAKQRGIHLLRCDQCGTLSDLSCRSWRLCLQTAGEMVTLCPPCGAQQ